MAKLKVYEYPHPFLKEKAKRVDDVDESIKKLLDDMLETMYASKGVGLAANQVGVLKRLVVIDVEQGEDGQLGNPMFFVNPEIIWNSDENVCDFEGCLSVPEQRAEVERYLAIKVRYQDYNGKEQELYTDDFLAIALQHEIDHLDGVLYIDRISRIKRNMLLKKLEKMRKERL